MSSVKKAGFMSSLEKKLMLVGSGLRVYGPGMCDYVLYILF